MNILDQFALTCAAAAAAALIALTLARAKHYSIGLSRRWANVLVLACLLAYILVFGTLALLRHESLHSWYDLSVYDQTIWNSLNGRLMQDTIQFDNPQFLGFHFSPILLAFVPLYAVWPDARMLLISQTILLAVSAVPLYWYARRQIGNLLAVVLVLAFLLSPALENINFYDFHEIAVATPLLALACLFLLRRRYGPFLVCVFLLLLIKEETAIIIATFGIFLFLFQGKRKLGAFLVLFGGVSLLVLMSYVIPLFSSQGYPIVAAIYPSLGRTPSEIVTTAILHPDKIWELVWTPEKLAFVLHLFVPLAFVPLVGMEVAFLSFPTFAYLLVADAGPRTDIHFHYTATLLPFLFFAAVLGLRRLLAWRDSQKSDWRPREFALAALVLVAGGLSYFLQAPGPLARNFDLSTFALDERARAGRELVAMVPPDAIVVSQKEHLPQFSDRKGIYDFPSIPDYRQTEYLFAEPGRFWYTFHQTSWDAWFATGYFQVIASKDNFILARRRPPDQLSNIRFGDQITLDGYSILPGGSLRGGMTITPTLTWSTGAPIAARYAVAIRVLDQQGHAWAVQDSEPDGGFTPTTEWIPGRPVGDQYGLKLPPTMPPGEYRITARLHRLDDDESLAAYDSGEQALGTEPSFATVRIEKDKESLTATQLVDQFELDQPLYVDMADLRLIGYTFLPKQVSAGAVLPVGVYWRARSKPKGDYTVAVQLLNSAGAVVAQQQDRPAAGAYPTTQWDAGEVLLDWHDMIVPADLNGDLEIQIQLIDAASGAALGEAQLTSISVTP